jgi:hypothetical protein
VDNTDISQQWTIASGALKGLPVKRVNTQVGASAEAKLVKLGH